MIKSSQAETLHQAGYLQKHRDVFFYEWPTIPTIDEICQKLSLVIVAAVIWVIYEGIKSL